MARSLKKPPFVHYKLVQRVETMQGSGKKSVIKTWSRASTITPDFVGLTIAVHNGRQFIPVFVTENMGARKRLKAEARKEAMKNIAIAKLNNCPTSPRKMRLVADTVRGKDVFEALNILRFSAQEASGRIEKLLRSAIANWEAKNSGASPEDSKLTVSEIFVDSARMLKRIQPAPQGRAHRIRKRSNHVTIIVDSSKN